MNLATTTSKIINILLMRKKAIVTTPKEIDVLTSISRESIKGGDFRKSYPDLPQMPTTKNDPVVSIGVAVSF